MGLVTDRAADPLPAQSPQTRCVSDKHHAGWPAGSDPDWPHRSMMASTAAGPLGRSAALPVAWMMLLCELLYLLGPAAFPELRPSGLGRRAHSASWGRVAAPSGEDPCGGSPGPPGGCPGGAGRGLLFALVAPEQPVHEVSPDRH